jgi:hypothetical protein
MGLVVCATKDDAVVHYTLEGLPNKVLAAEYRTTLPDEHLIEEAVKRTRQQLVRGSKKKTTSAKYNSLERGAVVTAPLATGAQSSPRRLVAQAESRTRRRD